MLLSFISACRFDFQLLMSMLNTKLTNFSCKKNTLHIEKPAAFPVRGTKLSNPPTILKIFGDELNLIDDYILTVIDEDVGVRAMESLRRGTQP